MLQGFCSKAYYVLCCSLSRLLSECRVHRKHQLMFHNQHRRDYFYGLWSRLLAVSSYSSQPGPRGRSCVVSSYSSNMNFSTTKDSKRPGAALTLSYPQLSGFWSTSLFKRMLLKSVWSESTWRCDRNKVTLWTSSYLQFHYYSSTSYFPLHLPKFSLVLT